MRPAVVLIMAGAALLISYLGDQWLLELRIEAARQFDHRPLGIADTVTRVVVAAVVLGLAWVVFRGAGSRVVGVILATVGLFTVLVPTLWWLGVPVAEFAFPVLGQGVGYTLWTGASIAVLGVFSIVWPSLPGGRV